MTTPVNRSLKKSFTACREHQCLGTGKHKGKPISALAIWDGVSFALRHEIDYACKAGVRHMCRKHQLSVVLHCMQPTEIISTQSFRPIINYKPRGMAHFIKRLKGLESDCVAVWSLSVLGEKDFRHFQQEPPLFVKIWPRPD
jgi:hypothetical protein